MQRASILIAGAGICLAGYALASHLGLTGGASEPEAVVVTLPQRAGTPAAAAVRPVAAEPQKAAATPGDRASLARELQRELQRVGCYDGDINGSWTTSSRMAMKAFTDRVNASLPIDAPDYILLSLVQRHQGKACGVSCPTGQSAAEDGRCVPSAVLAKAAKLDAKPASDTVRTAEAKPDAKLDAKPADRGSDKSSDTSGETGGATTPSWSPTAGVGGDLRRPPIRGNSALVAPQDDVVAPKPLPAIPRQDRSRVAAVAAAPDADDAPDPAAREPRSSRRSLRSGDPLPAAGIYDQGKKRKRYARSKPPKIVRKFLRSMERNFAGAW